MPVARAVANRTPPTVTTRWMSSHWIVGYVRVMGRALDAGAPCQDHARGRVRAVHGCSHDAFCVCFARGWHAAGYRSPRRSFLRQMLHSCSVRACVCDWTGDCAQVGSGSAEESDAQRAAKSAIARFNASPWTGLSAMWTSGLLKQDAASVAAFLKSHTYVMRCGGVRFLWGGVRAPQGAYLALLPPPLLVHHACLPWPSPPPACPMSPSIVNE